MEKRALGKGLAALIQNQPQLTPLGEKTESVSYVKTDLIKENSFQPRVHYNEEKLNDLILSIKEKGVLQPILVREIENGYETIAGERRLRAARALNLESVPVIVKKVSDQEALVIALVENIQREELNPLEEAQAFRRLTEEFNLTQEDVAQAVGKNRSTISNTLRLLKLPEKIQNSLIIGNLSMGHARALLSLENPEEQSLAFNRVIQKGLSVRELENLIKAKLQGLLQRKIKNVKQRNTAVMFLEEELQQILGTKVRIQAQKKRGKIIIEYYSNEDLDRILNLIKK